MGTGWEESVINMFKIGPLLQVKNGSEMGSILPKDTEQMLAEELQLEFSLKNCEIWEKIQTPFN